LAEHDWRSLEARLRARADGLQKTRGGSAPRRLHTPAPDQGAAPRHGARGMEHSERAAVGVPAREEDRRPPGGHGRALVPSAPPCVACGSPILAERLRALPQAVRCLPCQRAFEEHLAGGAA
jgi:Prokaryotic dksA/traR C4-type zinc finger